MDRHILGTFTNEEETVKEVKRLINDKGYRSEELALIIDKHNEFDRQLNSLREVQVEKVEVEEESVWEKIKDTFSIGAYDSNASHSVLEEYGVPHDKAEHYMDALRDGEIVLLADTDAPKHNDLSNLNEEMIDEENYTMTEDKDQNKPVDEVNSEEEKALKGEKTDKDPKDVETSETDQNMMGDSIDPSQADQTRKENTAKKENDDRKNDSEQGKESKEEPDLTGQEDTVESEDSNHGYGNTIADGVVKPEAKSPLNTDVKHEKEPSEKSSAPESDAKHTDDAEEAGLKSQDN